MQDKSITKKATNTIQYSLPSIETIIGKCYQKEQEDIGKPTSAFELRI